MPGLEAKIGLNATNFTKGINEIKSKLKSLAGFGIGGISVYGVVDKLKSITEEFDNISESSKKLGISTDFFQKLSYSAKIAGGDIDSLVIMVSRMQKVIESAKPGGKTDELLKKMGLNLKDLQGLDTENQLLKVTKALSAVGTKAQQNAAGITLFGRSFIKNSLGLKEFEINAKRIKEMGGIIDEKSILAGERLDDILVTLSVKSKKWYSSVIEGLADMAEAFIDVRTEQEKLISRQDEAQKKEIENAKNIAATGTKKTTVMQAGVGGAMMITSQVSTKATEEEIAKARLLVETQKIAEKEAARKAEILAVIEAVKEQIRIEEKLAKYQADTIAKYNAKKLPSLNKEIEIAKAKIRLEKEALEIELSRIEAEAKIAAIKLEAKNETEKEIEKAKKKGASDQTISTIKDTGEKKIREEILKMGELQKAQEAEIHENYKRKNDEKIKDQQYENNLLKAKNSLEDEALAKKLIEIEYAKKIQEAETQRQKDLLNQAKMLELQAVDKKTEKDTEKIKRDLEKGGEINVDQLARVGLITGKGRDVEIKRMDEERNKLLKEIAQSNKDMANSKITNNQGSTLG